MQFDGQCTHVSLEFIKPTRKHGGKPKEDWERVVEKGVRLAKWKFLLPHTSYRGRVLIIKSIYIWYLVGSV